MPRKPRCRAIKFKPLSPPRVTRSLSNQRLNDADKTAMALLISIACKTHATGKKYGSRSFREPDDDRKLASLLASALKINLAQTSSPPMADAISTTPSWATPASPLKPPATVASTFSPMSKGENDSPKRRKREPIKLPPGAGAKLSTKDLKRLKNRVSAARVRQRSQQCVLALQDQLEHYRSRCEFLETVVFGCTTCASLSTAQLGDIELLPAGFKVKMETKDEEDLGDDTSIFLTEAECVVLHDVLHNR
ncbi:hypothetical protein GN958_ATG17495 [Phytophthora infestans]|uniref:BZIP domain-containing protein n=1 Tax=Phytophthora infestans TaxID=4787 RepID=A0A8S9U2B9_PHYIN|nr:hypothetical protein GN958_ATG17495 [Phytophthora infestans]